MPSASSSAPTTGESSAGQGGLVFLARPLQLPDAAARPLFPRAPSTRPPPAHRPCTCSRTALEADAQVLRVSVMLDEMLGRERPGQVAPVVVAQASRCRASSGPRHWPACAAVTGCARCLSKGCVS